MLRAGLARFRADRSGLTAVEYSLLLAFIGAIVVVAMIALASSVGGQITQTTSSMNP